MQKRARGSELLHGEVAFELGLEAFRRKCGGREKGIPGRGPTVQRWGREHQCGHRRPRPGGQYLGSAPVSKSPSARGVGENRAW